jgi:3-deoxy-D-manno-octulosonic-acid transferase
MWRIKGRAKNSNNGHRFIWEKEALKLYIILMWLLSPVLWGYTRIIGRKFANERYIRQRLGRCRDYPKADIWLHAASVGEARGLSPLIRVLKARYPHKRFLITTNTVTGAKIVEQQICLPHAFLPIDWLSATRNFLDQCQPECALIMETEIWPVLYAELDKRGVPLLIVNGRLSSRSEAHLRWLQNLYRETLDHVTAVLARSDVDKQRFIHQGAAPERVYAVGNIKFGSVRHKDLSPLAELTRPYVLAASTHEDEEAQLLRLWEVLTLEEKPLLVIAPRHPHRADHILKICRARGVEVAVRSKKQPITPRTELYLADTLGELEPMMVDALVVFMGGSLVDHGGHNILEPALLGKAMVFGPFMTNFSEEARIFTQHHAAIQVLDADALTDAMQSLLTDKAQREALGQRAQKLINEHADVVERYVARISQLCELTESRM